MGEKFSIMRSFIIAAFVFLIAGQLEAKSASRKLSASVREDQDEIDAIAARNIIILQEIAEQINRALLGDTTTMMAFIPKMVLDLTGFLSWFLTQMLTADPFATPGPPSR